MNAFCGIKNFIRINNFHPTKYECGKVENVELGYPLIENKEIFKSLEKCRTTVFL